MSDNTLDLSLRKNEKHIYLEPGRDKPTISIGLSGAVNEVYKGETVLYPDPDMIRILPTKNKVVKKSIMFMPIPLFQTENSTGGDTVYIGE